MMKNTNQNKDETKITRDVIDIALQYRSHNIGTVFICSTVYSTKVNYEYLCKIDSFLHEECVKSGFYLLITQQWQRVTFGKMECTWSKAVNV